MLQSGTVGILLALTTSTLWGALPLAVKQVLVVIDPLTIVWARFLVAAIWMWLWRGNGGHRPTLLHFSWRYIVLFSVAVLGLGCNFVLFNSSLYYLSAPASQIVGQAGPVSLMLLCVFFLGEPLSRFQMAGIAVLLLGMPVFFNQHLASFTQPGGDLLPGLALGLSAAFMWASYGVIQKFLLRTVTPKQMLRILYTSCAVVLFPFATPSSLLQLEGVQIPAMLFCAANTIVAYGAFTEALSRCDASKVSGILTLSPLFALLFSEIAWMIDPATFPTERLNLLGFVGAFVVVVGALMTIGRKKRPKPSLAK